MNTGRRELLGSQSSPELFRRGEGTESTGQLVEGLPSVGAKQVRHSSCPNTESGSDQLPCRTAVLLFFVPSTRNYSSVEWFVKEGLAFLKLQHACFFDRKIVGALCFDRFRRRKGVMVGVRLAAAN